MTEETKNCLDANTGKIHTMRISPGKSIVYIPLDFPHRDTVAAAMRASGWTVRDLIAPTIDPYAIPTTGI